MELYPRTNKIKLYYKPLIDETNEQVEENFDNKCKYCLLPFYCFAIT